MSICAARCQHSGSLLGRFLAFGTRSPKRSAIRIVGVDPDGTIFRAPMYVPNLFLGRRKNVATPLALEGRGEASCPRWSADGSRLAYLVGGKVVVLGLDGSFPRRRASDPARRDFRRRNNYEVVSPEGDRVARLDGGVVVSRLDGSEPRDLGVESLGTYALAAWSPDGETLLVMRDISGFHFTMLAVPVDAPSEAVPVAVAVRVDHPRSWPGHGDVSWQSSASASSTAWMQICGRSAQDRRRVPRDGSSTSGPASPCRPAAPPG